MNMKNHYKEKYWEYSNDDLKDIIAGRFSDPSDEEVAAAIELLKDRNESPLKDSSTLSLAQIPGASLPVLLQIIKNSNEWGEDAVEIAEAEILRRKHKESTGDSNNSVKKTWIQAILAILGIILTVLLVKMVAILFFIAFLFYCVVSCLDNL
jgi:hypothetical protein